MFRHKLLPFAVAMVGALACGGAGGSNGYATGPVSSGNPPTNPAPTGDANTVSVANTAFNPAAVTVNAGTTVTWKWATCTDDGSGGDGYGGSSSCPTHNVTFDDGSNIASQVQDAGEFTRTFTTPGTYKYHCSIHGASVMSGQIVVK